MSATEDESQQLDAGWDDEAPSDGGSSDGAASDDDASDDAAGDDAVSGDEVDEAWDSVVPSANAAPPSIPPKTEEVDGGWDEAGDGDGAAPAPPGKRRPHRERRGKSNAMAPSASTVLRPRPAENTKKQQREHARVLRAKEAQAKQQRRDERKAQRAAEARAEADLRVRQAEAAEQARRTREQARERAREERPAAKPKRVASAPKPAKSKPRAVDSKPSASLAAPAATKKSGLRPGVIITLLVLAALAAFLLLRK